MKWQIFCGGCHIDSISDGRAKRIEVGQTIQIDGDRNDYEVITIDRDARAIFVVEAD